MKFHNVLNSFCHYLLIASISFGILRADEENSWEIKEIDGGKYVAVEQIQKYYRFEKSTRNESSISLENDRISMNLKIGSQECRLNNIKIVLSKPVAESGDMVYVSSTDLAGLLDPMLRPTQIAAASDFRTVILDPAHGGKDPGFSNELGTESEFTFKIASLTKQQLEAKGFTVVMTRSGDEDASPEERLDLANKVEGAAIVVSISFNSGAATENGIQTFVLAGGQDLVGSASVALSAAIHGSMIRKLDKNTFDGGIKMGESGVFSRIKHPTVLVKPGFMTHPTDSRSIADVSYQAAVAKAIVEGISKYRFAVRLIPPQVKSGNAPEPE